MPDFLGFDTSNYTTSCAVFSSDDNSVAQSKKLLPVKSGELGLRQSDAVFHHVKQLPEILRGLFDVCIEKSFSAIGVSTKPRSSSDSYMPCFLCGRAVAESAALSASIPVYETSHQVGHVLAALYSANALDWIEKPFYAYHVSGGTTDLLLCSTDSENIIDIQRIGGTDDLNAGQAIDRIGVALKLDFPCGKELEKLALKSEKTYNLKVSVKGMSCSLSGVQNKCEKMIADGESPCDIARFCLDFIGKSVLLNVQNALGQNNYPIVFAGGVMSNSIIRKMITDEIANCRFAEPEFSCDNAVGCAIFAYLKHNRRGVK